MNTESKGGHAGHLGGLPSAADYMVQQAYILPMWTGAEFAMTLVGVGDGGIVTREISRGAPISR